MQGFYANMSETVDQTCLGDSTFTHLMQFKTMLVSGDII